MKAPKLQAGTLTRRARDMETSRLTRKPKQKSPKARKPAALLKKVWRKVRKVDWKWILDFLKVIAALKSLLP